MRGPIGFYVTADEAQCVECHEPAEWAGFEEWKEPLPIFDGTAGDTPTHCADCGLLIEHGLTEDGLDYVAESLVRRDGRPDILDKWARTYGSQLDEISMTPSAGAVAPSSGGNVSEVAARLRDRLDRMHQAGTEVDPPPLEL